MTPTEYRKQVRAAGFSPVPDEGKAPAPKQWQKLADASEDEIELWERMYPRAGNTGILTGSTPALDADILDPDAAKAVEHLIQQRIVGGVFSARVGCWPKRAFLFRTDAPFKKILIEFEGGERLEFLGIGQQLVADGVHPGTGKPYEWHGGGKPGVDTKRADLP